MRHSFLITVLALMVAPSVFAQQKQTTDPYAPPPPPPKLPSALPDKNCSGQATSGSDGKWKSTSTCPPPAKKDDTPPLTTAPADAQQKKSTADDNPFPEDISRKAEDAANAKEADDSKPTGSTAQDENSSGKKLSDADLLGKENHISNGAGGYIHDPKMAADDVHVGQFYLDREDFKGAYTRFKEATLVDPENPEAVFYLAEASRRLSHLDEAKQNYQLYLAAMPDGPKAKDAKKALRELSASAKR